MSLEMIKVSKDEMDEAVRTWSTTCQHNVPPGSHALWFRTDGVTYFAEPGTGDKHSWKDIPRPFLKSIPGTYDPSKMSEAGELRKMPDETAKALQVASSLTGTALSDKGSEFEAGGGLVRQARNDSHEASVFTFSDPPLRVYDISYRPNSQPPTSKKDWVETREREFRAKWLEAKASQDPQDREPKLGGHLFEQSQAYHEPSDQHSEKESPRRNRALEKLPKGMTKVSRREMNAAVLQWWNETVDHWQTTWSREIPEGKYISQGAVWLRPNAVTLLAKLEDRHDGSSRPALQFSNDTQGTYLSQTPRPREGADLDDHATTTTFVAEALERAAELTAGIEQLSPNRYMQSGRTFMRGGQDDDKEIASFSFGEAPHLALNINFTSESPFIIRGGSTSDVLDTEKMFRHKWNDPSYIPCQPIAETTSSPLDYSPTERNTQIAKGKGLATLSRVMSKGAGKLEKISKWMRSRRKSDPRDDDSVNSGETTSSWSDSGEENYFDPREQPDPRQKEVRSGWGKLKDPLGSLSKPQLLSMDDIDQSITSMLSACGYGTTEKQHIGIAGHMMWLRDTGFTYFANFSAGPVSNPRLLVVGTLADFKPEEGNKFYLPQDTVACLEGSKYFSRFGGNLVKEFRNLDQNRFTSSYCDRDNETGLYYTAFGSAKKPNMVFDVDYIQPSIGVNNGKILIERDSSLPRHQWHSQGVTKMNNTTTGVGSSSHVGVGFGWSVPKPHDFVFVGVKNNDFEMSSADGTLPELKRISQ